MQQVEQKSIIAVGLRVSIFRSSLYLAEVLDRGDCNCIGSFCRLILHSYSDPFFHWGGLIYLPTFPKKLLSKQTRSTR